MRDFESEFEGGVAAEKSRKPEQDSAGAELATRSLAAGRLDGVNAAAMAHVQRLAGNRAASALVQRERDESSEAVSSVLSAGGQSLPKDLQRELQPHYRTDLGSVRIHTDATADKAATSVQSLAFTSGNNIAFKSGQFDPGSSSGKQMLAHELTHVDQQASGPVAGTDRGNGLSVSDPSDRFEQEAEAKAATVTQRAAEPSVQRDEAEDHAGHDHGAVQRAEDEAGEEAAEDVQQLRDPAAIQREAETGEDEAEDVQQLRDPAAIQRDEDEAAADETEG